MRIHRFYVPKRLSDALTVSDDALIHQWRKVLRIPEGGSVRLFDGCGVERLYIILAYSSDGNAILSAREDLAPIMPSRHVTLFFSLLKKDKNEWVIQKCTEVGVSRIVPVISERTEKTGFSLERAKKITIEAAEQCGRGDIPEILEPMPLSVAIREFSSKMRLFVCEKEGKVVVLGGDEPAGYFVGPEGGWTDAEKTEFMESGVLPVSLGGFTLRAETACIAAALRFSIHTEPQILTF
jgi:16S rRNA (uracil1498-N3)-methyltransferase